MKYIVSAFLIVLVLGMYPTREHYIKVEPVKKNVSVKPHKVAHRKYVPPTGKALEIAQRVSKETGVNLDTISKIMFYESGYNLQAKHINNDKSFDSGLMQLNSQHIPEAKKLGLDIMNNPDDNATFAIILIKRNGLRDWRYSQKNWNS